MPTGRPFENTVPALDILGVLMKDEDLCYRFLHDTYEMKELCPPLSCTEPEKGILGWRAWCLVKMIMASDIADIRDDTIK